MGRPVMSGVFISYAGDDEDSAAGLRDSLRMLYGIEAWVYSYDAVVAQDSWDQIESSLRESAVVVFLASRFTRDSQGQHRELQMALHRMSLAGTPAPLFAIIILEVEPPYCFEDVVYSELPPELRRRHGLTISRGDRHLAAYSVAAEFFPGHVAVETPPPWLFPCPGEWLRVSVLDVALAERFRVGDYVYFRRLSPMGLFDCYCPQTGDLFWFYPHNLSRVSPRPASAEMPQVPTIYSIDGIREAESRGYDELLREGAFVIPPHQRRT